MRHGPCLSVPSIGVLVAPLVEHEHRLRVDRRRQPRRDGKRCAHIRVTLHPEVNGRLDVIPTSSKLSSAGSGGDQ